jgi:polyisoprenoid-binding protein YceI
MSTSTSPATSVRTLTIDRSHSEALFTVRHLITKVRGRFRDFEGTITYDEAHPERSRVQFTIQASSIDTNEPNRDTHLRSGDFFDVDRFPTITFVSTGVAPDGSGGFNVTGDLTIRDVCRPVVLPVAFHGFAKDPWGNQRAGFETELKLNRKDYGLNWNAALETGGFLVGDEVTVTLSIQAVAQS